MAFDSKMSFASATSHGADAVDPRPATVCAQNKIDAELIGAMMKEVAGEIECDALLAFWQEKGAVPISLYLNGDARALAMLQQNLEPLTARIVHEAGKDVRSEWRPCQSLPGSTLVTALPLEDGVLTLLGYVQQDEFGAEARSRKAVMRFLPVLQPFFRMWARRRRSISRLRGLRMAIDHSDVATLLLSREGEILLANGAADRLMEEGDGLGRKGSVLSGSTLSATMRLQAAIQHVCADSHPADFTTPVIGIPRKKRRPLMVTLIAAENASDDPGSCAALAYAFDPEQDLTTLIEPACKMYGLSPSETKLTCRLADGATLAEAAAALSVREQTARSYLKQIFLKTETSRQAELVGLMLKSTVRTRQGHRAQFF